MILFVTKAQIEARLSAKRLKRIYDDNSDGLADVDAVNQLRADASSKVRSYLEPMGVMPTLEVLFNQTTGELISGKVVPDEIVRLTLDVVVALACQRFPEVMRQDWVKLMDQCDKDLCKLRDGKTSLGGGTQGGVATPVSTLDGSSVIVGDGDTAESNNPGEIENRWSNMGEYS